ncbi:Mce protein [Mycobacterium sp. M1]|uniref:Mce protein n=1 Tax=Mycolicibacter acidiphilus TaxID=2835306 RepID=A0ABS5RN07_9MYCO|nr:Mce protein [Mycolicibacter acidiphilus]MBS9535690.1 Mce protein [Mycolicibacter acidiphilus]
MSTTDDAEIDSGDAEIDGGNAEIDSGAEKFTDATVAVGAPARPRRWVRITAVAAAYAAVFGAVGGLGWLLWQQHLVNAAGVAGQQAASAFAEALTSIDSDDVDRDFDAVLNGSTGEFRDTYTKASQQLRQLLVDNKATAQGEVIAAAVQSESKDRVVVLLMVNQTITNTARPDPRVDRSRMKMTMEKVDGRWLASKVELP